MANNTQQTAQQVVADETRIRAAVALAIKRCGPMDSWVAEVDDTLEGMGFPVVPVTSDDPWVIAQLRDGRTVVYREGRGNGPDAYEVV